MRVGPDLTVPGHPQVFVIGDAAAARRKRAAGARRRARCETAGTPCCEANPRALGERRAPSPFRYRDYGNFATIGRKSAVIELPFLRLQGLLAWWIWGIGHIYFLIGVHSPILVALSWLRQYLTFGRGARLITGSQPESADSPAPR